LDFAHQVRPSREKFFHLLKEVQFKTFYQTVKTKYNPFAAATLMTNAITSLHELLHLCLACYSPSRGRGGGLLNKEVGVLVRNFEQNPKEVPRSCFVGVGGTNSYITHLTAVTVIFFSVQYPKRYQKSSGFGPFDA